MESSTAYPPTNAHNSPQGGSVSTVVAAGTGIGGASTSVSSSNFGGSASAASSPIIPPPPSKPLTTTTVLPSALPPIAKRPPQSQHQLPNRQQQQPKSISTGRIITGIGFLMIGLVLVMVFRSDAGGNSGSGSSGGAAPRQQIQLRNTANINSNNGGGVFAKDTKANDASSLLKEAGIARRRRLRIVNNRHGRDLGGGEGGRSTPGADVHHHHYHFIDSSAGSSHKNYTSSSSSSASHLQKLVPYANPNYVSAEENAAGGPLWGFDVLEKEHNNAVRTAAYPRLSPRRSANGDINVLFVDGQQQCELSRGFLVRVRQSGFKGLIVFMVYQRADEVNCQPLAGDFAPMFISYRPHTPRWEPSMLKFYGVVNYFRAMKELLEERGAGIGKVILVQPESVFWCNETNPFEDIPRADVTSSSPLTDLPSGYRSSDDHSHRKNINPDAIYGIFGKYDGSPRVKYDSKESCSRPSGYGLPNHRLFASFIGASTPNALMNFCLKMISFMENDPHEPVGAGDVLQPTPRQPMGDYLARNGVQMQPQSRFEGAACDALVPEDTSACFNCNRHTILADTAVCVRHVTYKRPNYSPYCDGPYRDAILEVPSDLIMDGYANPTTLAAAHRIRDNGTIFRESMLTIHQRIVPPHPSVSKGGNSTISGANNMALPPPPPPPQPKALHITARSVSPECPNGVLAIFSAMSGYKFAQVRVYIGSFLAVADNCTKLVMMIKFGKGIEDIAALYPDRLEVVSADGDSPYLPNELKHCPPADYRFEVGALWLERNYHRFRYVISTDSRDYMWLSNPFTQLLKILKRHGYEHSEFVGSVGENYVATASTEPDGIISHLLRSWVRHCGSGCWRRWTQVTFTNGDPLAVLNSGHIIGSSLGMLHYYRFHVRMMIESKHDCHAAPDQGPFTYHFYGMMQAAQYPHKILVFTTSRSGFVNLPKPVRVSKRPRTDIVPSVPTKRERDLGYYSSGWNHEGIMKAYAGVDPHSYEYTVTDCDNNIVAGLHQFDREGEVYSYLERSPVAWRVWKDVINNPKYRSLF